MRRRVHAWKAAHGYQDDDALGLFIWPEAVNFLNPQDVDLFIHRIILLSPTLVIGDTLARCMPGGDENSAKDMGLLVEHTDRVRHRVGCAFMWVHHTNRVGSHERGSSALRGACDTMLRLSDKRVLTCDKQRDGKEFHRLRLRLEPCHGSCVMAVAPEPSSDGSATGDGPDELEAAVLSYVRRHPGRSTRQVASGVNRNRDGVTDVLKQLRDTQQVRSEQVGKAVAWTVASTGA